MELSPEIKVIASETSEVFDSTPISKAYFFGSKARNHGSHTSDFDILFEAPSDSLTLFLPLKWRGHVDLLGRSGLNGSIRSRIENKMVLIYNKLMPRYDTAQ